MKIRTVLLLIAGLVVVLIHPTCGSPQPANVAGTPIPTLIPATLPPERAARLQPVAPKVTFPSRQPSARAARELYQRNCANCHGANGTGIVPGARDFSDTEYLRGETPLRVYQIISNGRGAMPGWQDKLSVDERWDLTLYIWHFVTPSEMLERGKAIYQENCANCHGSDGKGMMPGMPDFTNVEWLVSRAPCDFFEVVTEGKGTMPSWQGRLRPGGRWAAIEYLRSFAYEPPAAATTASK